jgi:hypothetical protein
MTKDEIDDIFAALTIKRSLTGNRPFPWQRELYKLFARGELPRRYDIPTGIGKTSVIADWLIALADYRDTMPGICRQPPNRCRPKGPVEVESLETSPRYSPLG